MQLIGYLGPWRLSNPLLEVSAVKYFKGHGFDIPCGSVCYVFDRFEDTRTLQHLSFSPATNPGNPGRLVAGDRFPGRHVARDMSNGKARWGARAGRQRRANIVSVKQLSATVEGFPRRLVARDC
ncbi:hypothetical protein Tco_0760655 [Tanacetum coccineum]